MSTPLHVLILEDRPSDAELVVHELRRAGFAPVWQRVETEAEYLAALDSTLDLILADYSLPQFDALRALELLHACGLTIPLIIVSGTIGEDIAVTVMQQGAADYLLKDRLARLGAAVEHALEQRRLQVEMQRAEAALMENAKLQQAVLRALTAEIAVLDSTGMIITVNDAWTQFTRTHGGDPLLNVAGIGVNYLDVCRRAAEHSSNTEATIVLAGLQAIIDGQQSHFILEYRCQTATEMRWFVMHATPLAGQAGVVVAHEDITARKRTEEALRSAETKYRTLVEHLPAIVYQAALDSSSSTLYVNEQIEKLMGFTQAEWIADPLRWLAQLHPRDLDDMLATVERTRTSDTPVRSEFRMLTRDGRIIWFADEAVVVRDGGGQPLFIQGIMLDITARKRAEQALQESEERYRLITENTGDLISMRDQNGRFVYVSPSYQPVLGYDPAMLIGLAAAQLIHPDDHAATQEAMRELDSVGTANIMQRQRHADGSWRWIEGQITAVVQQERDYTVTIGRDITERKRLEAQFLQAQKMESVGLLAGGMAHDFNNLLTVISGFANLAQATLPAGDVLVGDLEEIIKATGSAATLTRQLLVFASKQVIEPRVINLNDLIIELEKLLRRLLGANIELVTLLAPDLGQIKADPGQIEQVLVNLAVNARDAMPSGGKLSIETHNIELDSAAASQHVGIPSGSYVFVKISDTGIGMDAQTQEHVFEPFFSTKGLSGGTGLGLATCYGIIKRHGGSIWVDSEPQRGTSFVFYMPRVAMPAEQRSQPVVLDELPGGTETVLLAEDNLAVRTLIARILRNQGYTVLEAADGEAALHLAHPDASIDMLITDLVMPHMSGKALFEQLDAQWPGIKTLFISGYADDAVVHHGWLEPGVAFLHKPFSPVALARKVRMILDS